jgi:hypothetical protein
MTMMQIRAPKVFKASIKIIKKILKATNQQSIATKITQMVSFHFFKVANPTKKI